MNHVGQRGEDNALRPARHDRGPGFPKCGPLGGKARVRADKTAGTRAMRRIYRISSGLSSARNLRESRNTTTLRGGSMMDSLVWGLRPLRAFLS